MDPRTGNRCLLCNSTEGSFFFLKPAIPIFLGVYPTSFSKPEKFPVALWQCIRCGFVQQEISDSLIRFLQKIYSQDSFISTPPGISSWGNYRAKVISDYLERFLESPGSILEIGCQSGFLLSELQKKFSCRAVGIEPGSVQSVPENITFINDFFPSESLGDAKFDVIICQAVIEHVFDPLAFLKSIKKHLNPSGIVLIQVPDCTGHFAGGDIGLFSHEHISYFTTTSLEYAVRLAGFSSIEITNKIPGGHLLGIVTHGDDGNQVPGFDTSPALYWECFDAKIEQIRGYFSNDAQVGLYGVCAGAHNFIQVTSMGGNVILYDSDEFKHGKFLTDVPVPIHNYTELDKDPTDTVLIIPYLSQNEIFSFLSLKRIAGKQLVRIYL
jgi:2-polyprenyl-3-methyl-5-hydroxy-6-metoxy-1,4-benzoquinol methylase